MVKKINLLLFLFLLIILQACTTNKEVVNISVKEMPEQIEIGTFDDAGIRFVIEYTDGSVEEEEVTESTIPEEYRHYLYEEGEHSFSFLYKGIEVNFKFTMYNVKYQVSFENAVGEIIKTIDVIKGERVEFPTPDEMEVPGYRFLNTYDHNGTNIISDIVIKGNYVKVWTVTFYDGFNNLISTQIVDENSDAIAPSEESVKIEGYKFVSWDKSFTNITSDLNVYGVFEKIEEKCNHNIIPATCTKASYCSICKLEFGLPLEHTYVDVIIKPTCENEGYTKHTCICGDTYIDSYVPTIDHEILNHACVNCSFSEIVDGIIYSLSEDKTYYKVFGYLTNGNTKIHILEEFNDLPVKEIGDNSFKDNDEVVSIVLPATIEIIGSYAFYNCINLEIITIPESVIKVRNYAFANCIKIKFIEFKKNDVEIGEGIYYGCSSIEKVELPENVESITDNTFKGCLNIKTIMVPSTVINISINAFNDCHNLIEIIISSNNNYFVSINGILYSKDVTTLIKYPSGKKEISFNVPNTVTLISKYAFNYCILKEIYIGFNVIDIYLESFSNCSYLENIYVDETNPKYGSYNGVLYDRKNDELIKYPSGKKDEKYELPANIKQIGNYAFYECLFLKDVVINKYVTLIGISAFEGCINLETIILPSSVLIIKENCFKHCYLLTLYLCASEISDQWDEDFNPENRMIILNYCEHDCFDIIKEATCETQGFKYTQCSKCNDIISTEIFGFIDHMFVDNKCTMCGKTKYENIVIYEEYGRRYVNIGKYPQSVVSDENLINILDTISCTNSLGYIEYGGEEYKKIISNVYKNSYKFINGNKIVDNAVYYFKVEPIKWRVLNIENNECILLCEMLLENIVYNQSYYENRIINNETIYSNNYKYSNIRAWLNGYDGSTYNVENYSNKGFYDIAFTEEEKTIIKNTFVDNSESTTGYESNQYACENTIDKVYLLSNHDLINNLYGYDSSNKTEIQDKRKAIVTDYARAIGSSIESDGCGYWWMRSPSYEKYYSVHYVSNTGYIGSTLNVANIFLSVRPAIKIALNFTNNNGNNSPSGTPYVENGQTYVNLGKYPQSVVTDENLISILDTIIITNSLGYIEYNGAEYKKIIANPYSSQYTFINKDIILSNNRYYFKVEPIKWRVLYSENNEYTLLCEMLLDSTNYYPINDDVRTINGENIYPNNYKYSNVRAWLNGYDGSTYNVDDYTNRGFYDVAFTKEEKALIKTSFVDNSASSTGNTGNQYACENTNDKIYLLTYQDIINPLYNFVSNINESPGRMAKVSDYARANGSIMNTDLFTYGNSYWMLRLPANNGSIKSIWYDGRLPEGIVFGTDSYIPVRPVVKIIL